MAQDPYGVLGVARTATHDEIRKAYRKQAKLYHPDLKPNDKVSEEKFKAAGTAFGIIGDEETRAKFDRGEIDADGNPKAPAGFRPGGPGGFGGFGGGQGGTPPEFEDLFADLFGGRRAGPVPTKGEDIRFVMDVSFVEAITGGKRTVTFNDGRKVEVSIPAGVETGQTLRVRGQGNPGRARGPAGDALGEVRVGGHAFFKRDGDDVRLELPVSLVEAVEGGKVAVPTPTGTVTLTVPPNSSSGATLRLKGRGVAKAGKPGDLFVRLLVMLPEKPNAQLASFLASWDSRGELPARPREP